LRIEIGTADIDSPFENDQTGESSALEFQISSAAEIEKSVPIAASSECLQ
jgi:hypothetical protein